MRAAPFALVISCLFLAPAAVHGAAIDPAASDLAGAELVDLSQPGALALTLLLADAASVEVEVMLDPGEAANPVGLAIGIATLGEIQLSELRVSTVGAGVALGTVGSFARDGRSAAPAPAAVAGRVALPLDAERPLHALEIGATGARNAAPWTIDASGLGAPHRFRLRIEPVPEPAAWIAALVAIAALRSVARRRRMHAALAAVLLVGSAAPDARAANVSVTSGIDGAVGSLRERLANAVQDGDTITFSIATVGLATPLDVSHQGLTFTGPVTIQPQGTVRSAITTSGNGITWQGNIRFVDVTLSAGGEFGVTGFRSLGNRFEGDAALSVSRGAECELRDNVFAVAPSSGFTIGTVFTDGCIVAGNTIATTNDAAIEDSESEDLTIDQNTADASITLYARSGSVTRNEVPDLWVFPPGAGANLPLLVSGNDVDFLFVKRANVEVLGNAVHAAEGFGRLGAAAMLVHGGPSSSGSFSARENVVTGGGTGVFFADLFGPALASELLMNDVSGATRHGISARLTGGTHIATNVVAGNGTTTAGTGIQVLRPRTPGVTESNTVSNTLGAGISVLEPNQAYTVRDNEITGSSAAGIEVVGGPGRVSIEDDTLTANTGPGVAIGNGSRALVSGGSYASNGNAGILVFPAARAEIAQISASDNAGPGIDLWPPGVTANDATKEANEDLDWPVPAYDPASQRIVGTAAPLARVEAYAVEAGPRTGNPQNGEGQVFLGAVTADAAGRFAYPAEGTIACTPELRVTFTATVPGADAYTSEFSTDFDCDADADGVAVPDDRCPDTPAPNAGSVDANGCHETRTQPDGTEVSCNTATSCSAATQDGRGPCFDCAYRTAEGAYWDCFGGATCATSLFDEGRSCVGGCSLADGALALDCGTLGCDWTPDLGYRCDGEAGGCTGSLADRALSCPIDLPCEIFTSPGANTSPATAQITIAKESIGGDGSFEFSLIPGLVEAQRATIETSAGAGGKLLRVVVPGTSLPGASHTVYENVPIGWALAEVVCDGGVEVLEDGVRFDPVPGLDLHCTFVNERLPGPTRPAGGVTAPDAMARSSTFGLPPGNRIVVAGANGLVVMDPLTGAIPTAGTTPLSFFGSFQYQNLLGALVVETPAGDGSDAIFAYKSTTGGSLRSFLPEQGEFGFTVLLNAAYRDAVHLGADPAATEALLTTTTAVQRLFWTDFGVVDGDLSPTTSFALANFGTATPVSAYGHAAATRVLAVTTGTPGQLVIGDPASPFTAVTNVGSVGDDPRRIRCLGSVCAISNFGSDSLTIATWDGGTNVAITDSQAVGTGPIGIDLRALPGGDVAVASTGFGDATYSVTRVSPAGAVVASATLPAPAGCAQPGHALWLRDVAEHLVLSCFGSDAIAVFVPDVPAP